MKVGLGAMLLASALLSAWAAGSPPSSKAPSDSDRIKALPDDEREWLTEFVAPIILPEERKIFLALEQPYQREEFKRNFWDRRESPSLPPPLGPGYRVRYPELRRLVEEKYDGWRSDAGRIVILHGEPAEVFEPKEACLGETFRNLEIWTYRNFGANGVALRQLMFFRVSPVGPRRLWNVNVPDSDVFVPNSCRKKFDDLAMDCTPTLGDKCWFCLERCDVYKIYLAIRIRQPSGAAAAIDEAQIFKPFEISTEGLDRLKNKWATASNPDAKPLTVEGPSYAAPAAEPTPEPRRTLARQEIREAILELEPKYKSWLDLAAPLLSEQELVKFLLSSTRERDAYMKRFFKRKS